MEGSRGQRLECGDMSPLSDRETCLPVQSAVMPAHSKRNPIVNIQVRIISWVYRTRHPPALDSHRSCLNSPS